MAKWLLRNMFVTTAMVLIAVPLTGCGHTHPKEEEAKASAPAAPKGPSMEAKQLAADTAAPFVTELTFSKGKTELNQTSKGKLDTLLKQAKAAGELSEVVVVTWADEEYPSVHTKKLNSDQRTLAANRSDKIKAYIGTKGVDSTVNMYNMAERPGMLSELFSTSNARIKKALEVSGIPNTDTNVKAPSKVAKSIVMVMLKE